MGATGYFVKKGGGGPSPLFGWELISFEILAYNMGYLISILILNKTNLYIQFSILAFKDIFVKIYL